MDLMDPFSNGMVWQKPWFLTCYQSGPYIFIIFFVRKTISYFWNRCNYSSHINDESYHKLINKIYYLYERLMDYVFIMFWNQIKLG